MESIHKCALSGNISFVVHPEIENILYFGEVPSFPFKKHNENFHDIYISVQTKGW
jgi:hypothetical protein